jgi:hypothetical protein
MNSCAALCLATIGNDRHVRVFPSKSDSMNTTERIVESYFRLCKNCFTDPDVKVAGGNNRQLDLLAYNLRDGSQYHIETSVTHELSWRATWDKLKTKFDGKYFGAPREKEGPNTDYSKGKNYFAEIKRAYKSVGFTLGKVQRVWVTWVLPLENDFPRRLHTYCKGRRLGNRPIQVVSFRDQILPELHTAVGKSNYNDDVLRTLSLLGQFKQQRKRLVGDAVDF